MFAIARTNEVVTRPPNHTLKSRASKRGTWTETRPKKNRSNQQTPNTTQRSKVASQTNKQKKLSPNSRPPAVRFFHLGCVFILITWRLTTPRHQQRRIGLVISHLERRTLALTHLLTAHLYVAFESQYLWH
jgi:hypothetical protein